MKIPSIPSLGYQDRAGVATLFQRDECLMLSDPPLKKNKFWRQISHLSLNEEGDLLHFP